MKIWLLSSNRWNSAVTEYALSSARALRMRGHDIVFTPLAGSSAERRASDLGMPVQSLTRFTVSSLGAFRKISGSFRPDVIVTFGGPETFLARFSSADVVRVRGVDIDPRVWFAAAKQRLSHNHVRTIITPSLVLAEKLRILCGQTPVVPVVLGCDTEKFQRRVPREPKKHPNAVIFGRFDPVKGHEQFLKIWRMVRERLPAAVLRIVGEPANVSVDQIKQWAANEGLSVGKNVEIVSTRVHNVAELLSSATIGVVPSLGSEIIGRVSEEFLLCGTPVLVSGVGSLEEVIFDASAGASWRGLHETEIAQLVCEWLNRSDHEQEPEKLKRASQAAQRFSIETMGKSLENILAPAP